MIEAALVFPLVILTAVAMLYLMLGLYGEAESSTSLHMELRVVAEGSSGTYVEGASGARYSSKGIVNFSGEKLLKWRENVIDEELFIRLTDAGKGIIK